MLLMLVDRIALVQKRFVEPFCGQRIPLDSIGKRKHSVIHFYHLGQVGSGFFSFMNGMAKEGEDG